MTTKKISICIMKVFLFILIYIINIGNIFCQEIKQPVKRINFDKERLFTGGGLGFQFGTETIIEISPILGYKVTDRFFAGIGAKYQYYRYHDKFYDFSTSIYGGSIFSRYLVLENLFAHGEIELINYDSKLLDPFQITTKDPRINVTAYLLGGGYRQRVGGNSYLNFLILWNFNESIYTIYSNPIIRIGVDIGF